jgi:glycosyltransferase involved in cell wall biosynthesis
LYRDQSIVVAIPAYRAESSIAEVIRTLPEFVDHVIVVDDASPDRTSEVLSSLANPRVEVVRHAQNQGVGGAMCTAFGRALDLHADIVVKVDSDGQMDPAHISPLLDAILDLGIDYAKGNRFLDGQALARMPRLRLIGNLGLTFLTKLASGYWHIFDPQNGFVACRRSALEKLPLERLARDYFFENDMLIHLNIVGCRVADIPMPARYGGEVSSLRVGQVLLSFPFRLWTRYWRRIYERYVVRDFSPIAVFLFSGSALLAWGIGFGSYHWYISWRDGVLASAGTVLLAALPFLVGFQLVLQAIVLDIQSTPR